MKLLHTKEARKTLCLFFALSALAAVTALFWDLRFFLFTVILCGAFILIYFLSARRHYRCLNALADDIDRILHGEEQVFAPENCEEGELGVLRSEIYKMTVRLRRQSELLRRDKAYLADMIADISHQIRTPLTSCNLLVSFLSDPGLTDHRRKELERELLSLLSRVDWLITSLLKLSMLDAGTVSFHKETLGMGEFIERFSRPLLVPMELHGQSFVVSARGNFYGDAGWTGEALGNILKNCVEHTPCGGTVTVTADENALYSEITVEDSGSGIDKADLPHIFERFYKGGSPGDKNFGIGLALAKKIITAQNGFVKAENILPHGARFTVRFYKGAV